jgi:flagellar hook-associated protein 2
MSLPPLSFTGFSEFSDDFAVILERTFEVANLPVQQLQTEQTLLLAEQQELGDLAATIQGLEDRFVTLGLLCATESVTATSADTDVATVLVTGTPSAASFDINVTTAAAIAQEVSNSGLADTNLTGLTADGIYDLTLGTTTTNIDLLTIGSGRTAGTTGAATPSPAVSVQVDFSNGLSGSISADLNSFFVASQAPATIGAGDTISVNFVSEDTLINEGITTVALTGTETTADIATLLNDQIALNADLAGKLTFSDEGGNLKLVVSDTVGQGFTFTSSSTGTVVSGLESGGTVGGHSAAEIAAALNAQVALDQNLSAANVLFTAVSGEVKVTSDTATDIAVTDNAQGTGFVSGLAGNQSVAAFENTLEGLRDFINTSSLGVTATILNTSSDPDTPEYHLSVTANTTGATTLTLKDSGASNLLTTSNQGTNAVFTVNGLPVNNSGNTITDFAPGLTLTIEDAGLTTVSIATDRSAISSALANVAADYNLAVAKLQTQIGEDAGVLSGSVIVRQAQQAFREITAFQGTGTFKSMVELGLELDDDGLLSFNSLTFNTLTDAQMSDVLSFVGDTTSGFAGEAFSRLKDLADPVVGQIQTTIDILEETDASITEQIEAAEERIDRLIANLEGQFAAADLVLSQLESQQTLLTSLFEAFQTSLQSS